VLQDRKPILYICCIKIEKIEYNSVANPLTMNLNLYTHNILHKSS